MADNENPYLRELSDAAKRVADEYNMHRTADQYGSIGKWMAVALADGSSDHTLYESRREAVRHQHHNETFYAFVQVGPWTMTPLDAARFLHTNRRTYDAGLKMADPEHRNGGRDIIRRTTEEDQYNQLRALFQGDRAPTNLIIPGVFNG